MPIEFEPNSKEFEPKSGDFEPNSGDFESDLDSSESDAKLWAEAIAADIERIPSERDILSALEFDNYELWLKMRIEAPDELFQWIDEKYLCAAINGYKIGRFRDYYRTEIKTDHAYDNKVICVNAHDIRRLRHNSVPEKAYASGIVIDYRSIPEEALFDAPANKRYFFANSEGFQLLHIKSRLSRDEFVGFTKGKYRDFLDLARECKCLRWLPGASLGGGDDTAVFLT